MSRYSRQQRLPEFGKKGQEKLQNASVLVIGAGGLGCPVIQYLVSAGMGRIGIADHDRIEESNLARQPLYTARDIGLLKAEVAGERAKALNPEISIDIYAEKFVADNAAQLVSSYDIIADCSDNYNTRYLVNDICIQQNKPWVFAAIEGWQGQISVFNFLQKDKTQGPSYRCLFPQPPEDWEAADCNTIGVIATLPAVLGSLQANEIIKCISGAGEPLSGILLSIDLLANHYMSFSFGRNDEEIQRAKHQVFAASRPLEDEVEKDWEQLQKEDYTWIDIRESFEWEEDPEIPVNIPYHELLAMPEMLKEDSRYMLVCDQGKRSYLLAKTLRKKWNKQNVFSLRGGIGVMKR